MILLAACDQTATLHHIWICKAQVSNGQQRYDGFNQIMGCQRFGDFGCSKCYNHFWKAVIVDYDLHVTLSFSSWGMKTAAKWKKEMFEFPCCQLLVLCLFEYMDSEHTPVCSESM